jgi:pimeloyl-ACP methyl ester carboxylesterase
MIRRDVERADNIAALQNHNLLVDDDQPSRSLTAIAVHTLVIHGTADPLFPLEHGEVLAEEIPGATLLTLDGAGHGIDRRDWAAVVAAIVNSTA